MNRIHIALLLAIISSPANAGFDYVCLEDCANEGNTFQYCTTKCAINDFQSSPQQMLQPHNPSAIRPAADAACLKTCRDKGYLEELCQKLCTPEPDKQTPEE
jgi:hypothetical protein